MGKRVKLARRLALMPSDFTWAELSTLMRSVGFVESRMGKTSGSRIRFVSDRYAPLILHKPHPKPILKRYQIKQIIEHLKNEGLL